MPEISTGRLLAEQIREAHTLFGRYLGGFDDANHTRQAPHLPNHAAWSLGHLALTLHRAAELFGDEGGMPEADFIRGAADGDLGRYGTESVSFGSTPTADPVRYPSWARCREILVSAVQRGAGAVARLDDEQLEQEVPWGAGKSRRRQLALRQIFHFGTHCGQIADLRRALNMGSIFK